jgi:DNA-binding transcriptional MerR regulator
MSEQLMTIRQMCDAFDVTPRALRFYETKELLAPIRQGTKRLFTHRDRARLKLILRGKRFGFSLEEIRQLLDLYGADEGHVTQMTRAREMGREHLAQMERQRVELESAISELREQLEWIDARLGENGAHHAAE